jgi:hypothetical protein
MSYFMEDPFFDPSIENHDIYFERGSQVELDRLMRLFILTEPDIDKHADDEVCLYAGAEDRGPYLEDKQAYCSRRLKKLAGIALSENRPVCWIWEYNDGASYRRSGYDRHPAVVTWEIGEVLEQATAREKMAARRKLSEYLDERGFDIKEIDAMAKGRISM